MSVAVPKVTIIGAGMSGPLLAIYLARRGFAVDVWERRGDLRHENVEAGKSIKLTLAERGLHALREVGLEDEVKVQCCIPLRGRAVHAGNGPVAFIPYGKDDREVIYSFSRTDLNRVLLDRAETFPNLRLRFHKRLLEIDRETASAVFRDDRTGEVERAEADFLVGADGAFSTVRQQMQRGERADFRQEFLPWGYKELSILAAPDGTHQMEKHALHIWPCGDHMLFALPNLDGSFNGVCTLPFEGEHGFDSIRSDEDVLALFRTYFGDALPFMPNLLAEFSSRRVSEFLTIRTSRWHHKGKVVLVGDAVHTVVPFYGQGMNSAFEDCYLLDQCIDRHPPGDWNAVFTEYQSIRKRHTDVLADLSVSNFHELRDTVRRPIVAARKKTSIFFNRLLGQHSVPLYTMVSHSTLPYADCVEKAHRQERIARFLGLDLVVGLVALTVRLRAALARRRARKEHLATAAARRTARPEAFGLALLLLSALSLAAQPPQPSQPPQITALDLSAAGRDPIRLDGVLDEEAWQRAAPTAGFTQREPATGQPASEETVVRVAYTHSTLYIAVQASTGRPEDVVAEEMQRDGQLYRDDSVIVLLDTFHDHRNAYWFETNANGARTDALVTDEGRDFNVQWDGVWDVASRRTAEGWSAEIAVPFATLRFNPGLDTWGFNVRRLIRHKREEAYWAPVPLEGSIFRVSLAGELTGLHPPPPGLNLRLKPFGVAQRTERQENDNDLDAGIDVKWGLTRTLTLDLTANTDFAESEVDDQQINLTRFSLFFPEKREFFLENAGIFEFGFNSLGTPLLQPFFSRRLGISPSGTVVPIDAGARLTGRVGPWSLGLLDVQTRHTEISPGFDEPANNWGVVRVKRNLGQRSTVGMIATNRQAGGDDFNRVFGLDADLYATDRLAFSGFYTSSDDPGPSRGRGGSWAGGARAAWAGPIWNWTMDAVQVGEDYNPEVGFLLRQGIRRFYPTATFEPRPQIAGVRNLHFAGYADLVTNLDNRIESRALTADVFGMRFQSEDSFSLFVDSSYERVPEPFAIGPGVDIAAGEYSFNDAGINFSTNNSRRLSLSGYVLKGQFYDGDRLSNLLSLTVRGGRHLRFDTSWARDEIDLPAGSFVSDILRQRVGISFTPDLSTNLFVQYNDLNDLLSLNLRFNWIYRPGSDIFLVFNQNWNAPGLSDLTRRDRAVILKLTYLLEF